MDIRYAVHPEQMKTLDTQKMREQFLVENLFARDRLNMVYSHIDRIIVGGISPVKGAVDLKVTKELGVDFFLQRREMGIINIGGAGVVSIDGKRYKLGNRECLYIGMGAKKVSFASADRNSPAKFYFNSPGPCRLPRREALPKGRPAAGSGGSAQGECPDHLPVHPSQGAPKLPARDGADHSGAGQQLEYDALPHP